MYTSENLPNDGEHYIVISIRSSLFGSNLATDEPHFMITSVLQPTHN